MSLSAGLTVQLNTRIIFPQSENLLTQELRLFFFFNELENNIKKLKSACLSQATLVDQL